MTLMNQVSIEFNDANKRVPHNQEVVKFIHASDIHLGAAQYYNNQRSSDFIKAFQEILSLAKIHNVNFIILGGDVFTSLEMLPGHLTKIINILKHFKHDTKGRIPIISIEGNHDIRKFSRGTRFSQRGQSWLKLIASLGLIILLDADLEAQPYQVFQLYNFKTKKGGKIQIKNVVIYGNRYIGQRPENFLPKIHTAIKKDEKLFNILIQHFGIEGQMKNIPGVRLEKAAILKDCVGYLALGHFHKQFILENWIFNPGSSEAVSSIDSTYKRGIFIIEISGSTVFTKKIHMIQLRNRKHQWETIYLPKQIRSKNKLYESIIERLKSCFNHKNFNETQTNDEKPILYLVLKGKRPFTSCKINEKELSNRIVQILPILYAKIYQKFTNSLRTLDKYM